MYSYLRKLYENQIIKKVKYMQIYGKVDFFTDDQKLILKKQFKNNFRKITFKYVDFGIFI